MNTSIKIKEIIALSIGIASLIIPSYFFYITSSDKVKNQSLIIFIGILIILMIGIIVVYFISQRNSLILTTKINKNKSINNVVTEPI